MATTTKNASKSFGTLQLSAITGALALASYSIYNISKKSGFHLRINTEGQPSTVTTPEQSEVIRSRISKTYRYLFGSITTTGATAYALYKVGFARKIVQHPTPWMMASFLTSITALIGTRFSRYHTQCAQKHCFWTLFNVSMGASLSVLGYAGRSIISQALVYTSSLMGGISMIAMSAPNASVLGWGSMLSVGLGLLNGFAMIEWWYPNAGMDSLTLPFSIGLFGLYTAYDTMKVMHNAQDLSEGKEYDPIDEQMDLYLDSANLFVDIVRLLLKLQQTNEEEDEESHSKKGKKRGKELK